jgi:hypothetical protein
VLCDCRTHAHLEAAVEGAQQPFHFFGVFLAQDAQRGAARGARLCIVPQIIKKDECTAPRTVTDNYMEHQHKASFEMDGMAAGSAV